MADRRCEQCKGSIPDRMSRQRNDKGHLVCERCISLKTPDWSQTHSSLTPIEAAEMGRRQVEAMASISRLRSTRRTAHDSGDNAIINHCPFCGSGAVIGSSDGTVTCEYCHSPFTVQVQPAHPFMPQTIDGMPVTPPGMPGDAPTEISAPLDPASDETEEGVAPSGLGDADPDKAKQDQINPATPGAEKPKGKVPPQFTKGSSRTAVFVSRSELLPGDQFVKPRPAMKGRPTDTVYTVVGYSDYRGTQYLEVRSAVQGQGSFSVDSLPQQIEVTNRDTSSVTAKTASLSTYATADGHDLDEHDYMARLALSMADDRETVLDAVRVSRTALQVTCPTCQGEGETEDFEECPTCKGNTTIEAPNKRADLLVRHDDPANFDGTPLLVNHDPLPDEDLLYPYNTERHNGGEDLLAGNGQILHDQFLKTPAEWAADTRWN